MRAAQRIVEKHVLPWLETEQEFAPGIIDTPGVRAQMELLRAGGLDIDKAIAANPVGLAGQPDHIARGVVFLASDLAAFVSGHVLVIDGGATA